MEPAEYILVMVNLAAGFSLAFPVSKIFGRAGRRPKKIFRYYVMLIGIYSLECVAIVTGMLSPVFSIGLALVWGLIFGLWLRVRVSTREALKASFFLALYSSLPAASFILVPVFALVAGRPILSPAEGARFGIPDFLPWPLNTILGFYVALVTGLVILKTVIITGGVSLLIHLGEKPGAESS